jgi:tetratricopeptide (TPR) repeat protein
MRRPIAMRTLLTTAVACWLGAMAVVTRAQDAYNQDTYNQDTDNFDGLAQQVEQLFEAGKYAGATELAQHTLTLAERQFGPDDIHVATALYMLGFVYYCQGRSAEAEPLLKRGLAIIEATPGVDDAMRAGALNRLAEVYETQGRKAEAKPLRERAQAIKAKGE